ncbi:putative acyl-coenzyme A synthetase [Choanephora cucurbitarum]|uniref:Putative acyl-coenzyme A synthetase n=1 Tax=Choanephora cucurbitarum TaxID=101091 RepID=A0A1C7NMN6_9FUNG|nr:putative acyl-coenzyme A synthetase [Choanephora cucurbitarum]
MVYHSKFSDLNVPKDLSLYDLIFEPKRIEMHRDKLLFVDVEDPRNCLTFSQAHELILKAGFAFQTKLGLNKGDVIAICSPNHIHYPVVMFGALCVGGISAAIEYTSSPERIISDMNTVRPKIIIAHPESLNNVLEAVKNYNNNEVTVLVFRKQDINDARAVDTFLFNGNELAKPYSYAPEDIAKSPAYLYFTSGTTGAKKAVMISQYMMVRTLMLTDSLKIPMPSILAYTEFHHASSLATALIQSFFLGYTVYVMPHYTFEGLCTAIESHKVGMMITQPYVLSALARDQVAAKHNLSSLKSVVCCGAASSQDVISDAKERLGLAVFNVYAMTEIIGMFTVTPTVSNAGGVGYLSGGFSAKLIDEEGNEVPTGQTGELLIKGPTLMPGYYRNPEATAKAFDSDGFFRTGDLFRINEDGCFHYVGRGKDLIKYKLHHIYPVEIEAILMSHPKVSDCAVIGVYQPELVTEVPRAYVSLVDTQKHNDAIVNEIIEYANSHLPDEKRLRGGLIVIDAFPRNSTGFSAFETP